ncbi:MAG: hypothetical protein MZU79_05055 [Anaerotruncus sp.]|nr:hypothetical protein [Anaerotruncus sp.]
MIDRVFYAITQEQRYYLNGALLSLKNRQMELISTDGHRLSYTKKAQDGLKIEKDISVIVAKKTLSEIRKLEDETVAFDLDENNLFFRVGPRTLISRIIESKFPNYQAVIPKDNPGRLVVPREELAGAIRRVSLLSGRAVQGDQVHHREEPHAAVLLQSRDRRGPRPAGRRLQGPGPGDRVQRPVPARLPHGRGLRRRSSSRSRTRTAPSSSSRKARTPSPTSTSSCR